MSKLIKPEEGMPADMFLDQIADDETSNCDGAAGVSYLVNPDICINPLQQSWLRERFRSSRSESVEAELAVLINSFRLDCSDCLRRDCPRRDPATSFTEIKKRDVFYEEKNGDNVDILGAGLRFSESEMWDVLIDAKIRTVGDLCGRSEHQLRALPGSSKELVEELKAFLSKNGLHLYEPQ